MEVCPLIIRVEKSNKNPYAVIDKTSLEDEKLSWKAKGILSYLLSKPDNWKPMLTELTNASTDGETSTRGGLKELEKHNYLVRKPIKENGKIVGWEHVIYEQPVKNKPSEKETNQFPHVENPHVENPHVETPQVENQALISNEVISNEGISNERYIYSIFRFWNSCNIIQHKEPQQKMLSKINARLEGGYTVDELKDAISNYAELLNNDKYYWTYKWPLDQFMNPNKLDRFLSKNIDFESFIDKRKINQENTKSKLEQLKEL